MRRVRLNFVRTVIAISKCVDCDKLQIYGKTCKGVCIKED